MSELTLYVDANYESPWALSAFVALEEKQLPYALETKELSKKETFAAGYGARTHKIPALRRGDFWLAESVAIAEYLAESFPFPGHPRYMGGYVRLGTEFATEDFRRCVSAFRSGEKVPFQGRG